MVICIELHSSPEELQGMYAEDLLVVQNCLGHDVILNMPMDIG